MPKTLQGQTAAAPVAGATRAVILQILGPRSLLFSKDRDKRQSASGGIRLQLIEAIQEVGIDLLNGPGERSRPLNVTPSWADSHSDALRHPKMLLFFSTAKSVTMFRLLQKPLNERSGDLPRCTTVASGTLGRHSDP